MKTLLLCLVLGCLAHADQVNCIKWKDANGTVIGTYCRPFSVIAGNGIALSDNHAGAITISTDGASVAAGAGGSDTQINFNSSGILAGSSGLTWNNSTSTLTATHITGLDNKPYIDVVRDCGAAGDGVTDDATVVNACFAANPGHHFHFPKTKANSTCNYLFGATLTPSGAGTIISGEAGGSYGIASTHFGGTELCFTPGITGIKLDNVSHAVLIENIVLNGQSGTSSQSSPTLLNIPSGLSVYTRTIASIQRATNVLTVTITAIGSEGLNVGVGSVVSLSGVTSDATMNGLCVVASISTTSTNPTIFTCAQNGSDSGPFAVGSVDIPTLGGTADGIRVCGNFHTIRHVTVGNFQRHGINGASSETGCTSSFSDDLIVKDSILYNNQGNGIFMRGIDSNAGLFEGNSLYYNGMWGAHDSSFLGNTWIANQASYNALAAAASTTPTTKVITSISRSSGVTSVVLASADTNIKVGSAVVIAGVTDSSFNTTAGSAFFVTTSTDSTHYTYVQPGAPVDASSSGGTSRMAKFTEAYLAAGIDYGSYKIGVGQASSTYTAAGNYTEGGQACKFGAGGLPRIAGVLDPSCVPNSGADWSGNFIGQVSGFSGIGSTNIGAFANNKDTDESLFLRAGTNGGTVRSFLLRWYNNNLGSDAWDLQVDPAGSAGTSGSWILNRGLSGVRRLAFFGATNSSGITRIDSESTGAVQVNNDPNSGTGGLLVASGGASPSTVATVDSAGKGTFNGGLVINNIAAPTASANQIAFGSSTASTVGSAGAASALPATPSGYIIVNIGGTNFKLPYYAN